MLGGELYTLIGFQMCTCPYCSSGTLVVAGVVALGSIHRLGSLSLTLSLLFAHLLTSACSKLGHGLIWKFWNAAAGRPASGQETPLRGWPHPLLLFWYFGHYAD